MKKFLLPLLLVPLFIAAQSKINGKVVDEFQQPIPFANVLLYQSNGESTEDRSISIDTGEFTLLSPLTGEFYILVTSMGFEEYKSQPFTLSDNTTINLSTLVIKEASFALQDVKVVGKKIPYKREIDRTVISLEEETAAAGSSILDILERTPGLVVDRQNNSISMLGKDGVNVMINDKMTYMPATALVQYLNGLSADTVKSIELITTPPAKYDAEGNSGYVNIILKKKDNEGYNGNFIVSNSTSYNDNKSQRNATANFNVADSKNVLSVNYSFTNNEIPTEGYITRSYTNVTPIFNSRSDFFNGMNVPSHNIRLTDEFNLTNQWQIGVTVTGYTSTENLLGDTEYQENESLNYGFVRDEIKEWKSAQINFFTGYQLTENARIDVEYSYLQYDNYTNYDADFLAQSDLTPDNLYTEKTSPFFIRVAKLDYKAKLLSKFDYTAGLKYVKSNFSNENLVAYDNVIRDEFSQGSDLDESLVAAYSQLNFDASKAIKFQLGLRYEHTDTFVTSPEGEVFVDRNYGNFFPSLFMGYKINDYNNLNLSYSKRIKRPAFTDMAPLLVFFDLNTAVFGNLTLQPSFSDNYQIDYRIKSLSISGQYSREKNVIARFSPNIDEDSNSITYIPNNFDLRESFNAIINFPVTIASSWKIRCFTTLSSSKVVGMLDEIPVNRSVESLRFNMNHYITLGEKLSMQLIGFYQTKQNLNNGGVMLPMGKFDVSLQRKINERLNITLNGTNLLNTMVFRPKIDIPELSLYQSGYFNFQKPQVKVTAAYNFGNQKVKGKQAKQSDESSRVNM